MVPESVRQPGAPARLPLAAALTALVMAAALAGCAQRVSPYEITGSVPEDYRTNHPILIEEQVASMDVPVAATTRGLTPAIRSNILGFAQTFNNSGSRLIVVVAPTGSPNQVAARAAAIEAGNVLRAAGVDASSIELRNYRAGSDEAIAPVRIAYSRIDAHTAPCGAWNEQMSSNAQNRHYGNFGCATQQNLAAMVNNPLDLLYPRAMAPADATRRSAVLDQYQTGSLGGAAGATE